MKAAPTGPQRYSDGYTPRDSAPARARRDVTLCLRTWGLDALVDDARLIVSELVVNAVQHTHTRRIGVSVTRHSDHVRIVVTDASRTLPAPATHTPPTTRPSPAAGSSSSTSSPPGGAASGSGPASRSGPNSPPARRRREHRRLGRVTRPHPPESTPEASARPTGRERGRGTAADDRQRARPGRPSSLLDPPGRRRHPQSLDHRSGPDIRRSTAVPRAGHRHGALRHPTTGDPHHRHTVLPQRIPHPPHPVNSGGSATPHWARAVIGHHPGRHPEGQHRRTGAPSPAEQPWTGRAAGDGHHRAQVGHHRDGPLPAGKPACTVRKFTASVP
ncbi:ATP-binding protein [Streptomyces goshikiensis]